MRRGSRLAIALTFVLASAWALAGCRRVDEPAPIARGAPTPAAVVAEPVASAPGTTIVVPDFARVAEELSPSVVTVISTVQGRGAQGQTRTIKGLGSGLIVAARGQVLTNE